LNTRIAVLLLLCAPGLALALGSAPPPAPKNAPPDAAQPSQEPRKLKPGEISSPTAVDPLRGTPEEAALKAEKAAAEKIAAEREAARKSPAALWYRGNVITLDAAEPKVGFKAQWRFERTADNDIRLVLDEQRKVGPQRGTMMIIGQQALLTRDLTLARPGSVLPAVDGPTLLLNLTLRMLERGVPEGPVAMRRERSVSLSEKTLPINIQTPSAQGLFLPPWQLTGKVTRKGDQFVFDLLLVSRSRTDANAAHNTVLRGSWKNEEKTPPVLPSEMALAGWDLYAITGASRAVGNQAQTVHQAVPRQNFATLGDLRKAMALGWPGLPDSTFHKK
jgi:hypothetical protein